MSRIESEKLFAKSQNSFNTRNVGDSFLRQFSDVEAISREAKASGEAIQFFHSSSKKLEDELQQFYSSSKRNVSDSKLEEISTKHACLALIYWLYPNHEGYNRVRNAVKMFRHASAAQSTSVSRITFSSAIGLMIQLRIIPFLSKAKKKTPVDLSSARRSGSEFLSAAHAASRVDLAAIVLDGLGFSHFLYERDFDAALESLAKARQSLMIWENTIKNSFQYTANEVKFFHSIASAIYWDIGICYDGKAEAAEGEEMRDFVKSARDSYENSLEQAMNSTWLIYRAMSTYNLSGTYYREGIVEFEKEKALPLLSRAVSLGEKSLKWFHLWSTFEEDFLGGSWIATFYQRLANYQDGAAKQELMQRSLGLAKNAEALINNRKIGLTRYKAVNIGDIFFRNSDYNRQLAIDLISEDSESDEEKVTELLRTSLSDCLKSRTFYRDKTFQSRKINSELLAGDVCCDLLSSSKNLTLVERKLYSSRARKFFRDVEKISKSVGLNETLAISCWRLAQVFDREGNFSHSSQEYSKARDAFQLAQLSSTSSYGNLYEESSKYMLAWSRIENAKLKHVNSDFDEASDLYREATGLIASTRRWKSRFQLFLAESLIEQAEKNSVSESSPEASIGLFSRAMQTLVKLESDLSREDTVESRSFAKLGRHLSSFCKARIILENSKQDFRIGNIERSISGLADAEEAFSELSSDYSSINPMEANELQSLASLCRALGFFQKAQLNGDSSLIQKAEEIFSSASENSKSSSLRPLLKGLSSFASFLYSSKLVEQSLDSTVDIEMLSRCGWAIDSAERTLSRLGNRTFLSMVRASKHILDASINMAAAEREVEDHETKAKLYSQAQRSLSLATKYYEELGSSEKLKGSLQLLSKVRQNRELIPLANKMFAEVASARMIYSAVSSVSAVGTFSPENSARQLDSSFLTVDVSTSSPLIAANEELSITFVLSNLGKERAVAVRLQEPLPEGFELSSRGERWSPKNRTLDLNVKLDPGASETIRLSGRTQSNGEFLWHPALIHTDSNGKEKLTGCGTAKVIVEPENIIPIIQELRSRKQIIEGKLNEIGSVDDKIFTLREELSRVEEELHRCKNEYENLSIALDQVRQDLLALNEIRDEALQLEERKKLLLEEMTLTRRIQRRRGLFQ